MTMTRIVVLMMFVLAIGVTAQSVSADGLVTVHGAACTGTRGDNTNITIGETGLEVNGARTEDVFCPLTNHWGGGTDWPSQVKEITVFFVTNAPATHLTCTAMKLSIYGSRIEVRSATGMGSNENKRVIVPAFTAERSTTKHNYVLQCTLPANTRLANLQYNTVAVP